MPSRNEGSYRRYRNLFFTICLVVLVGTAGSTLAVGPVDPDGREELRVVKSGEDGLIFSSWQESGRRWVSVSKDGGASWSERRAMIDQIPLTAGVIVPGVSVPAVPEGLEAGEDNRVFLVQFETQSLAEWRHQLREMGVEVLSFIPHNSHLVRMDPKLGAQVESKPFVRWVGAYEPSYRAAPETLVDLSDSNVLSRRFRLQTFLAGLEEKALLTSEVQAVGGQVVLANPQGYIVEAFLTDSQALELLASNHLQWIEMWSAPEEDMDIGRQVAGADYVFGVEGFDGTGVRAEVMDGNIDTDHGDFTGLILHGSHSGDYSHGTCTYGINFGDGTGNSSATGLVPEAQGFFSDSDYAFPDRYTYTAELVDPNLDYKCVYQSNSTGSTRTLIYTSISHEMDDIIWQYDIAIFQSQSNSGTQDSRPQAWAKNVIAVGGAHHYNNTDSTDDVWEDPGASYPDASIGPASDGRVKPDLTFFYDAIFTTDGDPGGYAGGAYTSSFGGTSGATPMAAGTSGLFFEMWAADVWGTAPGGGTVFDERPHFSTMKALLINTAEQYDFLTTNTDLTRFRQGWGRPNAQNAYDRAAMTAVVDEISVLQAMEKDTFTATVPAAQDALKVTMVYADRAGVPGSSVHRINDVTLKVTAPDGTTSYWGNNGLIDGLWSTSGGAADTINTVENVYVQNPAAGDWTIEVEAVEVNMDVHVETPAVDDQDYALVVYGVTGLTGGVLDFVFADGFEKGNTGAWDLVTP